MSNEQQQPEHAQEALLDALFEQSPVNIAALLRACADGELNEGQCERLKQLIAENPQAPIQHDFEQALRSCCGRAMNKPACPDSLRERVNAIAAGTQTESQSNDKPDEQPNEQYAQRVADAGSYTRDRSFWARSPILAIAAVLLLSFAGVLIWQSTNISSAFRSGTPLNIEQASYTERVGRFVLGEHTRCCDDTAAGSKLIEPDIEKAVAYFSERFEQPVQMPDMAQGEESIRFFGGGDCHVPETSSSGHMRFDATNENGEPIALSLFVAPDPGILPLEEGVTYRLSSEACDAAGARLFVWVSNGVQYLLVSEASDKTCASVRGLMKAPSTLRQI